MLLERIQSHFPHPLTACQQTAVRGLARFFAAQNEQSVFILRGYAGTGKTSLVGALVKVMKEMRRHVVLLAPTGRAAKVFSHHAGVPAYTIHKAIYRQQTFNGEDTRFGLGYNKHQGTLFIVDEASMIATGDGGSKLFGSGSLLEDLLRFVFDAENCKIIFVGDTANFRLWVRTRVRHSVRRPCATTAWRCMRQTLRRWYVRTQSRGCYTMLHNFAN